MVVNLKLFLIFQAVQSMPYLRGTTNTGDALRYTRQTLLSTNNGNRINARDIVIVITDGASNSAQQTLMEARLLRLSGSHVITIGVGNWLDQYELEAMASYPTEENRYHVSDFGSLQSIRTKLRDVICDSKYAKMREGKLALNFEILKGFLFP